MGSLQTSTHIDAPPERVFATITDLHGAAERISGIKHLEVLTDGPVGRGTRWRETRTMFGKDATEEMEITEFTPGVGYTTEAESCGCLYRCALAATPEDGGSRLTMTFESKPMTFVGKIMGAVMMPLMRKSMIRLVEKDLADIKRAVEAGG